MTILYSDTLVKPLCALLGIEPDKLLSLSVHLQVGEPVIIETSFYGETSQVQEATGVLPGFDHWRDLAAAYHHNCPCDDIGIGECVNCEKYREATEGQ